MHVIGTGFNYAFVEDAGTSQLLHWPDAVSFIEVGVAELRRLYELWSQSRGHAPDASVASFDGLAWSLHLARTPIAEDDITQHEYIEFIMNRLSGLPPELRERMVSIGIHLTGSRFSGHGLLGSADTYRPTAENLCAARRFIQHIQERSGVPVWLENANFYSDGVAEVLGGWAHVRQLVAETGCMTIFDVAHAVVEAANNGMSPFTILGAVPWNSVAEIHLSGITQARDGSLHDGHDRAVPESVWTLFDACRVMLADRPDASPLVCTIEHTAPVWRDQVGAFHADFGRLVESLATDVERVCRAAHRERYMKGYLRHVLCGEIPRLDLACEQRGTSIDVLLEQWLAILAADGARVVFDHDEVPASEAARSRMLTSDFLAFAKQTMASAAVRHDLGRDPNR